MQRLLKAWLSLTPSEQKAVAVVLALALQGAGVRWWHRQAADERAGEAPRMEVRSR